MEETAATENKDETPSLADVWRTLKEIKVNTEKLVQEVETLKGNYEDLKKKPDFYTEPSRGNNQEKKQKKYFSPQFELMTL